MGRNSVFVAMLMAAAGMTLLLLGNRSESNSSATNESSYSASQNFSAGEISAQVPYTLDHEFTFRNDSGKPIDLTDVKPACGCTKWEASKRHFEPGETGSVKINLTLNGSGPASSSATLTWSTGEKTDVMLAAQALVPREVYLSTYSMDINIDTPASFSLIYVDQNGVEPPPVVAKVSGPAIVNIGEWKRLTPNTANGTIATRFIANGSVTITEPLTDVVRITLSLPGAGLRERELVVRTPELVQLHRHGRRPPPPITGNASAPGEAGK